MTADRCGSEARFPQLSGVGEALSPEESNAKVALHPSPWPGSRLSEIPQHLLVARLILGATPGLGKAGFPDVSEAKIALRPAGNLSANRFYLA